MSHDQSSKYFVAIIGACFLFFVIWLLLESKKESEEGREFRASASTTAGRVVELIEEESYVDNNGGVVYIPVVAYETDSGLEITFKGLGSFPAAYAIGDQVDVLYQESNPFDAKIDSFQSNHLGVWVFRLFGMLFTTAGAVSLYSGFRRSKTLQS